MAYDVFGGMLNCTHLILIMLYMKTLNVRCRLHALCFR